MGLEDLVTVVASAGGSLGGAFLAIRVALSNLDEHVKSNRKRLDVHDNRLDRHGNRITALETWNAAGGSK